MKRGLNDLKCERLNDTPSPLAANPLLGELASRRREVIGLPIDEGSFSTRGTSVRKTGEGYSFHLSPFTFYAFYFLPFTFFTVSLSQSPLTPPLTMILEKNIILPSWKKTWLYRHCQKF